MPFFASDTMSRREKLIMSVIKQNQVSKHLLITTGLFLFGFVTLIIAYILSPYDLMNYSLSRIGWRVGWYADGMVYLGFFVALSNITIVYAILVFIMQLGRKNLILAIVGITGRLFSAAGGLTPYRLIDPAWMINLHVILVYIGIFINSCVMMWIVIQFCAYHLKSGSHRIIAAAAWLLVIIFLVTLFFTIGGVAVFQLSMAASFAVVLLCVNWKMYLTNSR